MYSAEVDRFAERQALLEESQRAVFPYDVDIDGRSFRVNRGVFSPKYFCSTRVFSAMLDFSDVRRFLEIGTGIGVIALAAAAAGVKEVVATDVSIAAVGNARENVASYDVGDGVKIVCGDLFGALSEATLFDLIFWNSPWMYLRDAASDQNEMAACIADVGYEKIREFMVAGLRYIDRGGALLMGFASFGEFSRLQEVAAGGALRLEVVARQEEGEVGDEYLLLQILPRRAPKRRRSTRAWVRGR